MAKKKLFAKIRDTEYEIIFKDIGKKDWGRCEYPREKEPKIFIHSQLCRRSRSRTLLEIAIHEALHACHWDLCEDAIKETAIDIAKLLIKLGYGQREVKRKSPPT